MFCFVLVSCKWQAGKIERLYWCLVQQKTRQTLQGSAINKIPNIPQCTFPPRPMSQPSFLIFRGSGSETIPTPLQKKTQSTDTSLPRDFTCFICTQSGPGTCTQYQSSCIFECTHLNFQSYYSVGIASGSINFPSL